jgi:hypothetical protein
MAGLTLCPIKPYLIGCQYKLFLMILRALYVDQKLRKVCCFIWSFLAVAIKTGQSGALAAPSSLKTLNFIGTTAKGIDTFTVWYDIVLGGAI